MTWTSYLLPGLRATLLAAFFSIILAIVGGILLGMGRLSQTTAVRTVCGIFVEFFRAVPVLMMMLFAYYVFLFGIGSLRRTSSRCSGSSRDSRSTTPA